MESPLGNDTVGTDAAWRGKGWPKFHVTLLLVSLLVAVCFLFLRPDGASNDFQGHLAYLRHIQSSPWSPFEYTGRESWHPPTYYYVAAFSERMGSWAGLKPLKGARILSIVLFLLYIHFGLRTFRLLFRGRILWCASLLFVVWPSNFEMSTRINSDSALIPIYAAVQFYLIRAALQGDLKDCFRALCASFVGLIFKTSALVPVALACLTTVVMFAITRARNPEVLQGLRARWGFMVVLTFLVCVGINCSRLLVYTWQGIDASTFHLGGNRPNPLTVSELMALRPWRLFEDPFVELSPWRCSAAEYAFKSAIFTEQPWLGKGKFLGRMWTVVAFLQLVVVGIYLVRRAPSLAGRAMRLFARCYVHGRTDVPLPGEKDTSESTVADAEFVRWAILLPLALLPVAALLVFAWRQHWTVCGSYRFVHASLVAWIALLLMPAYTLFDDRCERPTLSRVAWLGAFTLMVWGIACLFLKMFRPFIGWN